MSIDGYLEIGPKRAFAGTLDWPGWARSGRDPDAALDRLVAYGPRYEAVVKPLRLAFVPPEDVAAIVVRERLEGDSGTDYGVPSKAPSVDERPLAPGDADVERMTAIVRASWATLARAVGAADGRELTKGPRGGGRSVEGIVDHVVGAEGGYLSRLGRRFAADSDEPLEAVADRAIAELEAAIREGIPPSPRGGKRWTPRYYVRRAVWHVLDHAWEIEDRTPR